jgi:uncharacterized protein
MEQEQSIIWRRLDKPGHEYARIYFREPRWYLNGTSIFVYENEFCQLGYLIECDSEWRTAAAKVQGWVGEKNIEIEIAVDGAVWQVNGSEITEVAGCTDIDLNFSPVTNTLPIRRLNLGLGEKAPVRAAWLRFPGFELELLEQTYERTGEKIYRYESAGGRFVTKIETSDSGLVTHYPNFWRAENT